MFNRVSVIFGIWRRSAVEVLRSVSSRIVSFVRSVLALARARMAGWFWISMILTLAIGVTAPHLLPVSLYKLSLITSAAWLAYWIDRGLFPYARPDSFFGSPFELGAAQELPLTKEQVVAFAAAQLRRALIISAAMIGAALGA